MKINEVEALIGITKKNIRFYEDQGLITPARDKNNGYRSYNEDDIKKLEQIKLLRKLDVSLEEIRSMQKGNSTVSDSMKRHLVSLQRKQSNLTQAMKMCGQLKGLDIPLSNLDVHQLLEEIEAMESTGVSFKNIQKNDVKTKGYIGAFLASFAVILMTIIFIIFLLWLREISPNDAPPLWFFIIIIGILLTIILGVIYAFAQRVNEIQKGEIDDARKF